MYQVNYPLLCEVWSADCVSDNNEEFSNWPGHSSPQAVEMEQIPKT